MIRMPVMLGKKYELPVRKSKPVQHGKVIRYLLRYLGKEFRNRLVKGMEYKESREEILKKYIAKTPAVALLEELAVCDDRSIQIILRNIDNVTLIRALAGASGKVCRKFLQNLSDRLLFFIDEDICQYNGSDEEIREAQKRILEMAVGMELIKA